MNEKPVTIRLAREADAPAIAAIFNHAIEHTTASFYTKPRTIEQQTAWLLDRGPRFPVWVAESAAPDEDEVEQVVGWVSLDPWSRRQAYRITTEISFYVNPEFHRRGIGRQLVEYVIGLAPSLGFLNLIARISEGNDSSVRLVLSLGFENRGSLLDVGDKFGKRIDVYFFQRQV